MGLNMMINGQYSFDVDLKIKLLYFNNGFKFSNRNSLIILKNILSIM